MKTIKEARPRTAERDRQLRDTVAGIIDRVRTEGDQAVLAYNQQFDGCSRTSLRVEQDEIEEAYRELDEQELSDLREALSHISAFAKRQKEALTEVHDFEPEPGIYLGHRVIPVRSCCCYIPGGNYPLYSTALMLTAPAKVAGVGRIAACSPVMKGTSRIHPMTLVALDLAGADEIYAVGGAQAIAAFSYGTPGIAPVDMIVGPGNRFVTEAKRQCYGQVGIDFIAGPSEVLIIADGTGNPEVVAADLLAQAEHDPNAKGILLSTEEDFAKDVIAAVERELETLPTAGIARQSWDTYGEVLLMDSLAEAVDTANDLAPEHLELNLADPDPVIEKLYNYGSLFIGENTAEVFGDYASGTNHTLPTLKAARYTGGVWVGTFLKVCTQQRMSREASRKISPLVTRLAEGEGLKGHAIAAEKRGRS